MRLVAPFMALVGSLTAAALTATVAVAAPQGGPLVTTDWLKANAADPDLVIIDLRDKVAETELGALPYVENAVAAPYASAGWRTEIQGIPGQIPSVEQITALIGSLGIDNDDHVVLIPWGTDSSEFGGATRVYWTFKYLGHDGVSILDGGWRQYDAAGGARVAEPVKPEPASFTATLRPEMIATTADVEAALKAGTKLIDGRPVAQFQGEAKAPVARVAGTIPGALNLPHSNFYSADYAVFAQPQSVTQLAASVGLGAEEQNIAFCNTGHWASIIWFGLHEIQGNKNTSMYDGSMAEWTADPARPVQ